MHEQMKNAFDAIHADAALKESTKDFVVKKLREKQRRPSMLRLMPVLACFACLIFGSLYSYFTPVSVISIDVNPSVELEVNLFGRVLRVTGFNDDGRALADSLDLRFKDYACAVEELLEAPAVVQCLDNNALLSISVAGTSEKASEAMLQNLSAVTPKQNNTEYYKTTQDQVETAHQAGMSCGKYRAYLQLLELDPTVTPQQINDMSMRQLQDLVLQLSGDAPPHAEHHEAYHPEETTAETIPHHPEENRYGHSHRKH